MIKNCLLSGCFFIFISLNGQGEEQLFAIDFFSSFQQSFSNVQVLLDRKCKKKDWYSDFFRLLHEVFEKNRCTDKQKIKGIPKIIHQIWLGSDLPRKYKKWQKTWLEHHPDWQYYLWTDQDVDKLELMNRDLYDQSINYGERSDLLRVELLYKYGGLYIDVDYACLKSFDSLHNNYNFYCSLVPLDSQAMLANGIFGSIPGHPILKRYLETVQDIWFDKGVSGEGVILSRGPGHFERMVYEYLSNGYDNIIGLPPSYLFPITHGMVLSRLRQTGSKDLEKKFIDRQITKEALAVHYWTGSWALGAAQVK